MFKKRQNIFYVLIALFLIPLIFVFSSSPASEISIVNLSGLVGLMLFSFQLLLGIPEVSRYITKDRISMIRAHVLLGIFGIVAILVHPISFLFVYSAKFSSLLTFNFSTSLGTSLSLGKIAIFLFLVVWLSSVILRSKLPYRYFKVIHIATYPIVILSFIHAYMIGSYINGNEVIRYWFMLLSVLVFTAVIYRAAGLLFLQKKYSISEIVKIGDDVNLYTLTPKGKQVSVSPGQFVYLGVKGELFAHPFTVLNVSAGGEIQVCIKSFGNFTKKLANCTLGSEITVSESHGVFLQNTKSERVVCVAGGIGITPFVYYVQSRIDKSITLHYFARNRGVAYFKDELSAALSDKYKEYFSDDSKVSAESVVEAMNEQDLTLAEFYLCGPPSLVKDIIKELKSKGVSKNRIFTEQFSF